ncbi:MAG: response regulator transcription factor [Steroidobacteraceae bacterium]
MTGSRPIQIFIVDDHPLVREWLGTLLREQPDFCVCGDSGGQPGLLTQIERLRPDVVVMDLSLPQRSGLDLIKDIRARHPSANIVVLSMHEEDSIIERALRAGARGYVTKRESTSHIVEAIRAVRDGSLYADAAVLARLTARLVDAQKTGGGPDELLSNRELEIFRRIGHGHQTRRIAAELNLSMKTVQAHCERIKRKLGLANAAELMRASVRFVERGSPDRPGSL